MKKPKVLTIYTDGGARGNPGPAAYGFVITDEKGSLIYEEGKTIGVNTNNVAEYSAVVESLRWVLSNIHDPISNIQFFMDSKLVCEQMSGRWKIKNENLRNLYFTIKDLENKLGAQVTYKHVYREKNKEADALVNKALDDEI